MYVHSLKNFKPSKPNLLGKTEILPPSSELINRLREINKEQLENPPEAIQPEPEIETNHTEKINELKQRRESIDEKKKMPLQSIPETESIPLISLSKPKKATTPRKPRAVKTLKNQIKKPENENPS